MSDDKPVLKDGKVFMPGELPPEEDKGAPDAKPDVKPEPDKKPVETPPPEPPKEEPPADTPPKEKPESAEEGREQREEFFQTRYQKYRQRLESFNPKLARKIDSDLKADVTPDLDNSEEVEEKTLMEMTPTELRKELREANREELSKLAAESNFSKEVDATINDLEATAKELELTDEDRKMALAKAGDVFRDEWKSEPSGPTRFGGAMAMAMENIYLRRQLAAKTTTASVAAEDKARAALLAGQPDGAPAGERGEPTEREQLLQDMEDVKPKSSRRLLDSERK